MPYAVHHTSTPLAQHRNRPWPSHATARFAAAARFADNAEPSLDEVMSDPIFACLLASDGLRKDDVAAAIEDCSRRLSCI